LKEFPDDFLAKVWCESAGEYVEFDFVFKGEGEVRI